MKNKGFTLVELLAILGILAIITLLAIPAIDSTIKRNKDKLYKQQIETIRNGLKTWGDANVEKLPEHSGDILTINVGYLKAEGFMQPDMVNVLTKQCFANDMSISIKKVNENYEYIVDDGSGSKPTLRDCNPGVLLYRDSVLNGADPILDEGMIPVYYDGENVKIAALDSEWYNYTEKKWANAVLVKSDKRETYMKSSKDTVINKNDILGYFVWIPKYKYRISTSGTRDPSTIDIVFESRDTKESKGNAQTEYRTHPAFKFGTIKLNGIWAGKFEVTGTSELPTVIPNSASLCNQNIYTQFTEALNFKSDTYGVTSNSHMIKPSEFGAVLYLSHSNYGINTKIRKNNNSSRLTGCGASTEEGLQSDSCEISFGNSNIEYPQSTTGNIYGVFDTNGGSNDRLMGIYKARLHEKSGFLELPESKYYDVISSSEYNRGCSNNICYGYGLSETNLWYLTESDYPVISTDNPFIRVGGDYEDIEGITNFRTSCSSGGANSDSFRVIITEE